MIASLLTFIRAAVQEPPWLLSRVVDQLVTTETGSNAAWQHCQQGEARTYPAVWLSMPALADDVTGFDSDAIMSGQRAHCVVPPDGNHTTDARIAEAADGSDRVVVAEAPRRDRCSAGRVDFVEFGLDVLVVHRRRGGDEPPG